MPFRQLFRPAGYVAVTLCLASTVLGGVLVPASGAAAFAARASVSPGIQYLGDSAGTTFTFTISNTSTTQSIGAVEIDRPGKSWTITGCPGAPVGWTAQRSDTMCRYRSGASLADDIAPGGESSAFKVTATSSAGSQNLTGTWPVVVSRNGTFDKKDTLAAAAAAPPGLGITVHSFQVLDVVVDPETTTPGDPCPTASKSAESASTGHTLVVCGRNRTTGTLTPTAARSSLAGTFISSADDFTSGPIAPTTDSRILGSWEDVTIATALGDDKTVIARIGSATNRTSPLTTLEDYEITSAGANTDPVADDDEATVAEDSSGVTVDVLGNDSDADGDALSVSAIDDAATDGMVTNNGTDVTYDPNGAFDSLGAGESATDTFEYTVSDGNGGTDTASVTITVTGVATPNTDPAAVDDVKTVAEDSSGVVVDVLDNDSDADGDALSVSAIDDTGTDGAVTNNGTDVTYDPNGAFDSLGAGESATDTFEYTVSDGNGGTDTASVTITVTGVATPNTDPVAVDDEKTVAEDSSGVVVDVLDNDTDADGDALSVSDIDQTGTDGVVTNNGTDVTYDPSGAFDSLGVGESTTDTFGYTVADESGGTDTGTVTITVTGVNGAPVIADIETAALGYVENAPATPLTATGSVSDVDSDDFNTGTLTVSFSAGGQAEDRLAVPGGTTIGTVSGGTNGSTPLVVTLNATATPAAVQALLRSVTYRNVSNAPSTVARTVRFVVTDGDGGTSAPVTRGITVTPVNDDPVAANDAATVAEDAGTTVITVLGNDTDADGDTLAVVGVTGTPQGTVTNNGTDVSYDPNGAFDSLGAGETATDTFGYTVSDGHGGTDTATVTITVTGVATANVPPVAVDDSATVGENDGPTVVAVLGNDTDANGDSLAVLSVNTIGTTGTVTHNGTTASYSPNGAFEALAAGQTVFDTFRYTVSDGNGGTDTAIVTITVTGSNDAPVVAGIETAGLDYTENDVAMPLTATGTVVDVDSDNLATGTLTVSFTAGGQAEDRLALTTGTSPIGTVVGGSNGSTPLVITLNALATPAAVQVLLRSVTYRNMSENPSTAARTVRFVLTDGDGGTSAPVTRGVTVTAVDDAPVAVNDTATVGQDAPATAVLVLANDTDVDGGPKTIPSASDPANGVVVLTGGSVGAHGSPDTFTYVLNGGDSATVSITVDCTPNTAPVAANDSATVGENAGPTVVAVLGNDTDVDGDTLAVTGLSGSPLGLVTNNGTDVSYSPNGAFEALGAGQTATDSFTYTVSDGNGGTDSAVVTITITGANDAPVIAAIEPSPLAYTENAAATPITASGTVADVDSANLATGTLTVSFTAGGAAEDRLAVAGGTTIGTVVGGTNGTTPLVITLNTTATPTAVQTLLRSITYANVSNNPSTAARTVRFVLTDGDGGTSAPVTRGIAITAVDDAPVAVNDTATVGQDAPATAVPVLTNDTDVDGGPKTISSASDPANGVVVLTGGSVGARQPGHVHLRPQRRRLRHRLDHRRLHAEHGAGGGR
ncbi:beta strand repeat-containing protein [Nocardioides sp. Root614]|uniref:beta strand repeat-containing protein n=1 Tax=Nocardioides sp. Root614 TaxID=1736571 RepID=UPI0009EC0D31|nr:Ig-like domain-containing protein [Nocardioides sp. Root614]